MSERDLVRRYVLEGFLQAKQGMSKAAAKKETSKIWQLLVKHSDYVVGEGGLPLRLFCTNPGCGKEYGECRDSWEYSRNWVYGYYMPKQMGNWAMEPNSLIRSLEVIKTQEVHSLGRPDGASIRRRRLMAWLEHLSQ
jgi:hypothetical protein